MRRDAANFLPPAEAKDQCTRIVRVDATGVGVVDRLLVLQKSLGFKFVGIWINLLVMQHVPVRKVSWFLQK